LAQAVLGDVLGQKPDSVDTALADRFVTDIVMTMHEGQGFVLYRSRVDEWLRESALRPDIDEIMKHQILK
jgi:flavin-dependent dehydrogenase